MFAAPLNLPPSVMAAAAAYFLLLVIGDSATGQAAQFTDVTQAAGIDFLQNTSDANQWMNGGAAVGDYDRDGWPDLYVTRHNAPDILYRNLGNGSFADVTAAAFSGTSIDLKTNGPVWGDVDNDGDLDLYVTTWGGQQNYLFVNDGGHFSEQSISRGAAVAPGTIRSGTSATFGDYDGDGYLDLYTAEWKDRTDTSPHHSRLLRNLGASHPGYFEDTTVIAGVQLANPTFTFAPRFSDLDRDGYADLTIASDYHLSKLFWNNGNGTFTNGTKSSGANQDGSAMGSTIGDYDNDGDLDWFLGNIDIHLNNLYQNQLAQGKARTFKDVTVAAGVADTDWSWGSSFLDFDNDGNLDLAVTNGNPKPHDGYAADPVYLFRNTGPNQNGEYTFSDSSTTFTPRDTGVGSGLVVFDYDRDGDQDLFIVNEGLNQRSVLYRNDGGNHGSYLRIDVVGTLSNRDGLGAWITVTPDLAFPNVTRVWEVTSGSNFLGQNELTAHFGWGDRTASIDLVEVRWPSGQKEQFTNVAMNTRFTATEPVPEPTSFLLAAIGSFWLRGVVRSRKM